MTSVDTKHIEHFYEPKGNKVRKSTEEWYTTYNNATTFVYSIHYYGNGKAFSENWYRFDGELSPETNQYYQYNYNNYHRVDGPAFIKYFRDGEIFKVYYLYAKEYLEEDYYKIMNVFKNKAKRFMRRKLVDKLKQTELSLIGNDVCNLITNFVY